MNITHVGMGERGKIRAFTLVELLVVIAIIGILIALLLPAVQAAREAARRMQCTNNMKQFSLSLHNYLDAHKVFPAAAGPFRRAEIGGHVAILPFIEKTALYDAYLSKPDHGYAWYSSDDSWGVHIPAFACPSDGNVSSPNPDGVQGIRCSRCNIVRNHGDSVLAAAFNEAEWFEDTSVPPQVWQIDLVGTNGRKAPIGTRGAFGVKSVSESAFTDGLSNTMAISETVAASGISERNIKGGIAASPLIQWGLPSECLNVRKGNQIDPAINVIGFAHRGGAWSSGCVRETGFTTSTPPNSPNCADGDAQASYDGFYPAQSNHTGGVNVGLMDGSVRFASDTVDCGRRDVRLVSTRDWYSSEKSPHGIWGGMSTKNCGEAVSLP